MANLNFEVREFVGLDIINQNVVRKLKLTLLFWID